MPTKEVATGPVAQDGNKNRQRLADVDALQPDS